jgi:hypothetical protein
MKARFYSSVVLAFALITANACRRKSGNPDKLAGFAMEAVTSFHTRMAKGQFADLCKAAEPTAFVSTTGMPCQEFLVWAHDRLGNPLESMRTRELHVEDRPAGEPVRVELHYATRYEQGLALEDFGWRIEGRQPTLISYRVEASAL